MKNKIKKIIVENGFHIETATSGGNIVFKQEDYNKIESIAWSKIKELTDEEIETAIKDTKEWLQEEEVTPAEVLTYVAEDTNPHWDELSIDVYVP